jgi:hypothetical protein
MWSSRWGEARSVVQLAHGFRFPRVRLLPSIESAVVDSVCAAIVAELSPFRASFASAAEFLRGSQFEEDIENRELAAYCWLALGDLANGRLALANLESLSERSARSAEVAELEAARLRAREMIGIVDEGPAAVTARLIRVRSERLSELGIEVEPGQ